IPAISAQVDALSGGEYSKILDRAAAKASAKGETPRNFNSGAQEVWDRYAAKAREAAGEREWGKPEFYTVQSGADANYADAKPPTRAKCVPVGVGGPRFRGAPQWHFLHYGYLELPSPMKSGGQYDVTLKDGRRVSFLYDEMRTVSRAIKVNQVGYLADSAHKYAYVGAHFYGLGPLSIANESRFKVVDAATGKSVLEGPVTLRSEDIKANARNGESELGLYGERIYEIDLGELKTEGVFFISVPGVGRSWPFANGASTYGEVFYTSTRGLYHQRCGIAYEEPYTQWKRVRCHTTPVFECDLVAFGIGNFDRPEDLDRFDVVGATTDRSRSTKDVVGGWHDAADWDRNNAHYINIYDLLYAYEIRPGAFADGQLNIPESGNGIPDVLDEAEFGLAVWTKSMTPQGGVSGTVETWTHPSLNADVDYAFSRRTRWDSLNYAAAAAQLALHLGSFDASRSARYRELAERAFGFGSDPANSLGRITINAKKGRGKGAAYSVNWEEKDDYIRPYLLHAKSRLFLLTNDRKYLDGIEELAPACPPPSTFPYGFRTIWPWIFYSLARNEPKIVS
ncbi:MAG: glycoside hydrolase family 9 protein, partial [Candidatus Hydrogenedentota bacterium]